MRFVEKNIEFDFLDKVSLSKEHTHTHTHTRTHDGMEWHTATNCTML